MIGSSTRSRVRIALASLALTLVCQANPAEDGVRMDEGLEERARARLITARVRILPTWGAEPGSCLEVDEQDLKVTLRGRRVGVESIELDRRRGRTLHALLIDTSGSMANSLDYVRVAARGYVNRLDAEYDRALIVTFDDSVLLHQGVTGDRELLADAVDRVRPGASTALNDGLHYVAQEMSAHRERPVIILLSDGHDTSSLHHREDVKDLLDRRPDLTVFTIGFNLGPLVAGGPPGVTSIRRYLYQLAYRTNGKFFDVPTGSRLDNVYTRINEMLNNEAIVRVVDPNPTDAPGKLKVSATKKGCKIQMFKTRDPTEDPLARPMDRPWADPPFTIDLPPDPRYLRTATNRAYHTADPECAPTGELPPGRAISGLEALWRAEVVSGAIRGCTFDVTMDVGPLYDLQAMAIPDPWFAWNAFLRTKTRWIEVLAPDLDILPERPEQVAQRLADLAVEVGHQEIDRDSRKKPYDRHARPYHDLPTVVHGRTFFDLRERLALALFSYPDYRRWVLDKLAMESSEDLQDLRERFRRRAPDASNEAIELALSQSEEGRRIRDRADNPSPLDLTRHLSAWLGDIPAIELFERWETEQIDDLLKDSPKDSDPAVFARRWTALRGLLFAPSYARELTLLTPAHDPRLDRIGFFRVVLPRPAWYHARIRNYQNHPGWTDLPFDLVPERPMAYRALDWLLIEHPDVAGHLRSHGYRVTGLDYSSFAKPRKQSPQQAFRQTRAAVNLASGQGRMRVEFDLERQDDDVIQTRLVGLRLAVDGDPVMESLAAAAQDRAQLGVLAEAAR